MVSERKYYVTYTSTLDALNKRELHHLFILPAPPGKISDHTRKGLIVGTEVICRLLRTCYLEIAICVFKLKYKWITLTNGGWVINGG